LPEREENTPSAAAPLPGVPGPLTFLSLIATAGRFYARKPFQLVGAFLVVYALGFGLGYAASPLEDTAAVIAAMGVRVVIGIAAAFASAYVSIHLADEVAGRHTPKGSAWGTLRVHAKELVTSGLLAVVIGFPLEFILPYVSFALVGPPIVVQVIALEYRSFAEALRRTGDLLKGQWGRVILSVLAFVMIVLVVFYTFVIYGLPLIVPFYAAGMMALYLDVRARAEGLDHATFVAEREMAMGERSAGGPSPD
jgi:hypothetical protein